MSPLLPSMYDLLLSAAAANTGRAGVPRMGTKTRNPTRVVPPIAPVAPTSPVTPPFVPGTGMPTHPVGAQPPQPAQPVQGVGGHLQKFWHTLVNDPRAAGVLLSAASTLSAPRQFGQSGINQFVNVIGSGYGYLAGLQQLQEERRRHAVAEGQKQQEINIKGEEANAAKETARARTTEAGASVTQAGAAASRAATEEKNVTSQIQERTESTKIKQQEADTAKLNADRAYQTYKEHLERTDKSEARAQALQAGEIEVKKANVALANARLAVARAKLENEVSGDKSMLAIIGKTFPYINAAIIAHTQNDIISGPEKVNEMIDGYMKPIRDTLEEMRKNAAEKGQAPAQSQYKPGDQVIYNGQKRTVKAVQKDGKLVLE